jgi:hypothetical protein
MSAIKVWYLKKVKIQGNFGVVSIAASSVTRAQRTRATGIYFEVERRCSLGNIHIFKVIIIIIIINSSSSSSSSSIDLTLIPLM